MEHREEMLQVFSQVILIYSEVDKVSPITGFKEHVSPRLLLY